MKVNSMFHVFASQEDRRNYGDSAFIEIQFCKLPQKTSIKRIVAVSSIKDWQNDSLYVNDVEEFERYYTSIFDCGIRGNLTCGAVDIFGINYFKPDLIEAIRAKTLKEKPLDYEMLLEWMSNSKNYNGFYILGI